MSISLLESLERKQAEKSIITNYVERSLKIERKIARKREDLDNYCWSLLPYLFVDEKNSFEIDREFLKKGIKNCFSEILDKQNYALENFLSIFLCYRISQHVEVGVEVNKMKGVVEILKEHNWLRSPEFAGTVLFLLRDTGILKDSRGDVESYLQSKLEEGKNHRDLALLVDSLFGLEGEKHEIPDEYLEDIDRLSTEKLSKLILIMEGKEQGNTELETCLKRKIRERKMEFLSPESQIEIFEGIKIANSKLSTGRIKEILKNTSENLKIDNSGAVTLNLSKTKNFPLLDVKSDALSYLALNRSQSDNQYTYTPEEHSRVKETIEEYQRQASENFSQVNLPQLLLTIFISIPSSISLGYFLSRNPTKILNYLQMVSQREIPTSIAQNPTSVFPPLLATIGFIVSIVFFYRIFRNGEVL